MSSSHDATFRWGELDHAAIESRMDDLKTQITSQIETADRLTPIPLDAKRFEPPRSHRLYRSFEILQEERADVWVERAYELYCEQWMAQGGRKTADFVNAVWCNALYAFLGDDVLPFLRLAFAVDKNAMRLTDQIYSGLPQGIEAVRRVTSVSRIYSHVLQLWQEKRIPAELATLKSNASLANTASSFAAEKAGVPVALATAYDRSKENALRANLNHDGTDEGARRELLEELKCQQRLATALFETQGEQLLVRVLGRTALQIDQEIRDLNAISTRKDRGAVFEHSKTAEPQRDLKASVFTHSETYESITFQNQTYTLQPRQAAVVKLLHEALRKGHPGVPTMRILGLPGCEGVESVRDIFKSRLQLWGRLIINCEGRQEGRGFYRLHDSIQG